MGEHLLRTEGCRMIRSQSLNVGGLDVTIQGGSNMTGTDLYVNKPHCAAAVRP